MNHTHLKFLLTFKAHLFLLVGNKRCVVECLDNHGRKSGYSHSVPVALLWMSILSISSRSCFSTAVQKQLNVPVA